MQTQTIDPCYTKFWGVCYLSELYTFEMFAFLNVLSIIIQLSENMWVWILHNLLLYYEFTTKLTCLHTYIMNCGNPGDLLGISIWDQVFVWYYSAQPLSFHKWRKNCNYPGIRFLLLYSWPLWKVIFIIFYFCVIVNKVQCLIFSCVLGNV